MEEKISDVLKREMDILDSEKKSIQVSTDVKKTAFAMDVKQDIGKFIKTKINNPDRHNPKKLTFWAKLKKAIGC